MPYDRFICLDNKESMIEDCLTCGCRLKDKINECTGELWVPGGRCLSSRTLLAIAKQREWKGTPSTTMLLRGTREAYLTITENYAVSPQSMIFALHGTKVHAALEQYTPEGSFSEERIFDGTSSGAFDFYEDGVLYDVKTYGSYAAAKTIGVYDKYIPDGVYKTGQKAGQVKWKKQICKGGRKNRLDLGIQLNDYRIKLEGQGYPVHTMMCEIIVRDGGTFLAKDRGIDFNATLVKINKISDHWVRTYMQTKAKRLVYHLESQTIPPVCKPRERWYNAKTGKSMKCVSFCAVRSLCDYGISQMNTFS